MADKLFAERGRELAGKKWVGRVATRIEELKMGVQLRKGCLKDKAGGF